MHVLNSPEGRGSGVYRWGNPPGALANQGITLAMWNTPPPWGDARSGNQHPEPLQGGRKPGKDIHGFCCFKYWGAADANQ